MKSIERLFQYIEFKEIKHTRFEKEIGLSNGYLSLQRKRNADLGESIILKIIDNCLDLNLEWLLTGKGSMLKTGELPSSEQCTACASTNTEERIQELKLTIETQRDLIHMLKEQLNKYKKVQPNT